VASSSIIYQAAVMNMQKLKPTGMVPPFEQKSFLQIVLNQPHQLLFQPPFLTSPNTPNSNPLLSS
jgi:hypothetical protein